MNEEEIINSTRYRLRPRMERASRKSGKYRRINPKSKDLYDGLEDVIVGIRNWIRRTAEAAKEMAKKRKTRHYARILKRRLKLTSG